MSDIYIPGMKSRFNSEKVIEDLMKIERIPKDKAEQNVESLETRKTWWQDLGRRISALRESAQMLFSFQNPFNERIVQSSNESVITSSATREADEREYQFTVRQLAQADRFLSVPLDEKTNVEAGTYAFTVGKDAISFNFRGGSLREFADALNRQGRNKIGASIMTVQPGTRSLLLESKITGAENRLSFSGDAAQLAVRLGMAEKINYFHRDITLNANSVWETTAESDPPAESVSITDGMVNVPPRASASVQMDIGIEPESPLMLKIATLVKFRPEAAQPAPQPEAIAGGDDETAGEALADDAAAGEESALAQAQPEELGNFALLSLTFSDGSKASLPAIAGAVAESGDFVAHEYSLASLAGGKTIASLNIENPHPRMELSIRDAVIFDPNADIKPFRALKPVSTAQDAVITMEGIELTRPSNTIDDIIPGITITARGISATPERLEVRPDREAIRETIIALVGNYNRLMAELNILTRTDGRLVDELTYLEKDEVDEMRKRLGAFSGDSTLTQFRSNLLRAVTSPYTTGDEHDISLLAQIGISTNPGSSGGAAYNPSRLRGYLDIDPKVLDTAMEQNLPAIRQLFAYDTTGDMLADTGVAYNLDVIARPYVELGGIISLKTRTIDSRISQDKRRIDTMERQLAAKEADLKLQYSRMENAYERMERMSSSLDNFSQRNNNR